MGKNPPPPVNLRLSTPERGGGGILIQGGRGGEKKLGHF